MLRLPVIQAQPGMVLALPVTHPHRPEAVLLRAGASLNEILINRLQQLQVGPLWIQYPGLEDLCKFVSPAVIETCSRLTTEVGVALDSAMMGSSANLDYRSYRNAVVSLLDSLAERPMAQVFIAELAEGDRPFVRHSANVCVLSLLMGIKLDFYLLRERARLGPHAAKELSGLGVGAMFHDVGMTRVPEAALARWNREHNEDDPEWRAHVQLGYDMVKDHLDPTAAAVVLNHHQRWDGTGFPQHTDFSGVTRPVAGSDIHVFARICAAAELFDRLRHPAHAPGSSEAAAPSIPAVRALRLMRSPPYADRIDPVIFRALVTVAPPFPPGTIVELSDGRRAAVVLVRPADPCRPLVEIVDPMAASSRRKRARSERIDLAKGGVSITRAEGHDVAQDLFFARTDGELDLARTARVMWGGEAA